MNTDCTNINLQNYSECGWDLIEYCEGKGRKRIYVAEVSNRRYGKTIISSSTLSYEAAEENVFDSTNYWISTCLNRQVMNRDYN
jgi:hypothetical protein